MRFRQNIFLMGAVALGVCSASAEEPSDIKPQYVQELTPGFSRVSGDGFAAESGVAFESGSVLEEYGLRLDGSSILVSLHFHPAATAKIDMDGGALIVLDGTEVVRHAITSPSVAPLALVGEFIENEEDPLHPRLALNSEMFEFQYKNENNSIFGTSFQGFDATLMGLKLESNIGNVHDLLVTLCGSGSLGVRLAETKFQEQTIEPQAIRVTLGACLGAKKDRFEAKDTVSFAVLGGEEGQFTEFSNNLEVTLRARRSGNMSPYISYRVDKVGFETFTGAGIGEESIVSHHVVTGAKIAF